MMAIVVDYDLNKAPTLTQGNSVVKLFLADATTKTFEVDDDDLLNSAIVNLFDNEGVGLAGTAGPKGGEAVAAAGAGIIQVGSVVEYSLDKDGNLNDIDFAGATGSITSPAANDDITAAGTNGLYIASVAVIFTDDKDSASEQ